VPLLWGLPLLLSACACGNATTALEQLDPSSVADAAERERQLDSALHAVLRELTSTCSSSPSPSSASASTRQRLRARHLRREGRRPSPTPRPFLPRLAERPQLAYQV